MVLFPDDASIPDLGSVPTNLGKLSVDDANDFLGHLTNRFSRGWSSQQMTELIRPPVNKKLS
jgi:hypothetical protein